MGIGFLSAVGVDSSCISLWARRHGYHFILFKNGYYEMCILFYASRDEETMKKKKKRRETMKRGKGEDMVACSWCSVCWSVGSLWSDGTANYFLIALVCLAVGGRRLLGRHVLS